MTTPPPDDDERRSWVAHAAERLTNPVRAAARAARGPLEDAADGVLSAPEITRLIDRMIAGPLPEELAQSLLRHRVLDRVSAQVAESGEVERLVAAALESPQAQKIAEDVLATLLSRRVLERVAAQVAESGEIERLVAAALASPRTMRIAEDVLASELTHAAIRHVSESPEVREAITRQTTGFAEEVAAGIRVAAVRLDGRVERLVHGPARTGRPAFGGIVTRACALAIDALVTLILFMSVVGMVSLITSLVGDLRPQWLVAALLASGWTLIAGGYFLLFWSSTGQTPGMRMLRLRVQRVSGDRLSLGRSLVRLFGLVLSIVPMFAGFVPVLFTQRRRGLADALAGTVVIYDDMRAGELEAVHVEQVDQVDQVDAASHNPLVTPTPAM